MNVCILATAQYFFYKVYFMYLLYILCISFHDCSWNNAEEMFNVCNSAAILEKRKHRLSPAALLTQECDFTVSRT